MCEETRRKRSGGKAMKEENDALEKNNTWIPSYLSPEKVKRNDKRKIDRYRNRLLSKRCSQNNGFDFSNTHFTDVRLSIRKNRLS